jgi:hypothetical protein
VEDITPILGDVVEDIRGRHLLRFAGVVSPFLNGSLGGIRGGDCGTGWGAGIGEGLGPGAGIVCGLVATISLPSSVIQ